MYAPVQPFDNRKKYLTPCDLPTRLHAAIHQRRRGHMAQASAASKTPRQGRRGAACINLDISALDALQNALHQLTRTDTGDQVSETLSDDIEHTVTQVVAQTVRTMDMRLPILGREQKIALIRRLDDKGVFQVQRAVPLLARTFGSSRATIYNYLKEARGGTTAKAARVARRAPRPAIAVPPRPGGERWGASPRWPASSAIMQSRPTPRATPSA